MLLLVHSSNMCLSRIASLFSTGSSRTFTHKMTSSHRSRRAIFLPCKRLQVRYPYTNRGEKTAKKYLKQRYIPRQLLTLVASNDGTQLIQYKITIPGNEKWKK